jgi:hypothetical protein
MVDQFWEGVDKLYRDNPLCGHCWHPMAAGQTGTHFSCRPSPEEPEGGSPEEESEGVLINHGLCVRCRSAPQDGNADELCPECAVIRARPFCKGCGYYYAVNGAHRVDCTAQTTANTGGEKGNINHG